MTTKIEWCARPGTIPESWNPVTGCDKVSPGCKNCYAERMARRLAGRFGYPGDGMQCPRCLAVLDDDLTHCPKCTCDLEKTTSFDVTLHPDRLEKPSRRRKPRTVFVCSMGDLFHEDVTDEFIAQVFGTMATAKRHTFQILTKRPMRMARLLTLPDESDFRIRMAVARNEAIRGYVPVHSLHVSLPLPNVWGMVSVESQDYTWRIEKLLQTPFAVRGVSCEPLLGPVDLSDYLFPAYDKRKPLLAPDRFLREAILDWVIVGGESGPGARPMHPNWARGLRDQCYAASVPFFFKQRGAWTWWDFGEPIPSAQRRELDDGLTVFRVGKKAAGRLLDGREWNEWPEAR